MFRMSKEFQKEYVTVSLVGDNLFKGIIFDSGDDIIVLFNGDDFIYIPVSHIEYIVSDTPETEFNEPSDISGVLTNNKELALDSILNEAKGIYVEICSINKMPLYGKILDVLDDYIVFYSPVYKKIYITKKHLKWLIPYIQDVHPYNLSEMDFNWAQVEKDSEGNFIQQLTLLSNKLVVLNLGEKIHQIGKIKSISDNMLELIIANGKSVFVNIEHIQTLRNV